MRTAFAVSSFTLGCILVLGTTMCSSSDSPSPTVSTSGGLADGRFRGVLVAPGDVSGIADITVSAATATRSLRPRADAVPSSYTITGTVTLNVLGAPLTITGTLDLVTNVATFSGTAAGGALTFRGTYADGRIRGTVTFGGRDIPLDLSNEELGDLHTYCGAFSGGFQGRWSVLTVGESANLVFASSDGRAGVGTGTLRNGLMTVALQPEGSATGNLSASRINGSWTFGGATGAFDASESECASLRAPSGDGGVPEAGPDAGPPGTPETIATYGGTPDIGHIALAAGKVYYGIDYPGFQQKRAIRAVGIDGSGDTEIVADGAGDELGGLTATSSKVFWLEGAGDNRLWSVPTAGGTAVDHGSVGQSSTGDYRKGVSRLVNDGTTVFLTWYGSGGTALRAYGLDGTPGASLSTDQVGMMGIGFDGADLLFGEYKGVQRVAKTLAGPTLVSDRTEFGVLSFAVNLAADADNVYFVTNESFAAAVWRKPKAGGAAVKITASGPSKARGLALVDDQLYFASGTSSGGQQGQVTASLVRVSKTATNATPTVVAPANLFDVVSDGTYVYWGAGKTLRRVHK